MFVPTWHVVVENKSKEEPAKNYYVNAIEKTVFSDPAESNGSKEEEEDVESKDQAKPEDPPSPQTSTSDK
ncbi:MAG: hypothetical protein WBV93_11055 [Anaerobacillus sp.]